jgi:hypothetical protein
MSEGDQQQPQPTPLVIPPQSGFPKSGMIEEPSEGTQESNVVPPDMGTEQ